MRYLAFVVAIFLVACGQPHTDGNDRRHGPSNHTDEDPNTDEDDDEQGDDDNGNNNGQGTACYESQVLGTWTGAFTGTVDTVAGSGFSVQNSTLNLELVCGAQGKIDVEGEVSGMACNGAVCATYSATLDGNYSAQNGTIQATLEGEALYFMMYPSPFTGELTGKILASGTPNPGGYTLAVESFFGTWSIAGNGILLGGSGAWFSCPENSASACQAVPAESWSQN